jgi:carboxyl-terminal processing protease
MLIIRFFVLSILTLALNVLSLTAKLPDISATDVTEQMNIIMKAHVEHKQLNRELMKRALTNYMEELDPTKTYFIEEDIQEWLYPSDALLDKMLDDYKKKRFDTFFEIREKLAQVIPRRHQLEERIDLTRLPKHVNMDEFKNMQWTTTPEGLLDRLIKIKALQLESSSKLTDDVQEIALQRIAKKQAKYEEEVLSTDPQQTNRFVYTHALKALASSLDSHTAYFTPDEAAQFMINVQQRLFGIGAQLRDDINGFTVVKIVEGGPAFNSKELKAKDRIIAVNGEPVVGMDIIDAVDLIRGEENTPVTLTVIREIPEGERTHEAKLDITIKRGSVVLKETRYEANYEPYGDGVIAYLRLYSFYQDPQSSSAEDLAEALNKIKAEHNVKGVILDLRYNSGGMLSQAVNVTGLFITKGVVVSIKDETGHIQHLRDLDGKTIWDGPLLVLVNRGSASASEIVAQTLQDYGRALIVGDDHTYGKGTFQTFTLNGEKNSDVNPKGEFKVTRGRYYTVSGKTPQLTGVQTDIVVPGVLSESEVGEQFGKYPLGNDKIPPNFDDNLSDIPFLQRDRVRLLYKFDLQKQLTTYQPYKALLKDNSDLRIKNDKNYQSFLKELKKKADEIDPENPEEFGQNDLQLHEAFSIMKDLILLMQHGKGEEQK